MQRAPTNKLEEFERKIKTLSKDIVRHLTKGAINMVYRYGKMVSLYSRETQLFKNNTFLLLKGSKLDELRV